MAVARAAAAVSANLVHPVVPLYFPGFDLVPYHIEAEFLNYNPRIQAYTWSIGCGPSVAAQSCTFPPNFYLVEGAATAYWQNIDAKGGTTVANCAGAAGVSTAYCNFSYRDRANRQQMIYAWPTIRVATATVMNVVYTAKATPTAVPTVNIAQATGTGVFDSYSIVQPAYTVNQAAVTIAGISNSGTTVAPQTINVPVQTTMGDAKGTGLPDIKTDQAAQQQTAPDASGNSNSPSSSSSKAAAPAVTGMAGLSGAAAIAAIAAVVL